MGRRPRPSEGKIDRTAAAASVLVLRPRYVLLNYVVVGAAAAVNTQRQSRELGREPHGTGREDGTKRGAGFLDEDFDLPGLLLTT